MASANASAMAGLQSIKIDSTYVDPAGGVRDGKNPVILLHAMLCSKEIWGDIPQTIADRTGRRVYTYDARNHGKSTVTDDAHTHFEYNVHDLFNLMDEMKEKPEQVIVVGHDMGGITAMRAALRSEKDALRFEKVIIIEMYAKTIPNVLIDRAATFMLKWTECVQQLPTDTPVDDVTRLSVENLYRQLAPNMQQNNEKESYLRGKFLYIVSSKSYVPHYNTHNVAKALEDLIKNQPEYRGTYRGPAYFIYGTESHYRVNDETDAMLRHFPRAVSIPVERGSHFFVADMPVELTDALCNSINHV